MPLKKSIKFFLIFFTLTATSLILVNSILQLYKDKDEILSRFGFVNHDDHLGPRYMVNPLLKSKRQVPVKDFEDIKINQNANEIGQWSSPIDWNVTAIHSTLLPNESVLTFGTFGIEHKHEGHISEDKKIKISDGRTISRDEGFHQWLGHDVNSGVDFDIWDTKKGFGEDSHNLIKRPLVMDSFCAIVRVIDKNKVLIVGGNKNPKTSLPDTQNGTMIYDIENQTFKRGKNINFKRWYGSLVRTGDEKLILIGGKDHINEQISDIPEILDLNDIEKGWEILDKAKSWDLFGNPNENQGEWNYPRSFLTSDGNVVGYSYNKIWLMDKNDEYRVRKTNEIKLVTGGISNIFIDKDHSGNHHHHDETIKMKLLTIGSPVGNTSSSVMIGKDMVYVFGGKQAGEEYAPSNKVLKIDFTNSSYPVIEELKSINFPRWNGNATILPTGEVLINGGSAYDDTRFSIFNAEIYNVENQTSKIMSKGYFRRNYHSTSLLLPDGSVLVSGGDVWNSEIFYPPYLFTKDWENKTVLAKRPKIENLDQVINRGEITLKLDEKSPLNIDKVSIISTGSTTHAQNSEAKFRSLEFSNKNESELIVKIPENKNELQNGSYMIFAITSDGVPSKGEIILLN